MKNIFIKCISTFFFVGYLPAAPGTYASIIGLLIYFLSIHAGIPVSLAFLLISAAGFLVSGKAEKLFHKKDPSCIVIDEVSGMLVSLLFLPYDIKVIALAFFIFRMLDIVKPFPADRLQHASGSVGIMSDDILAGLYTNAIIQIGLRVASLRIV